MIPLLVSFTQHCPIWTLGKGVMYLFFFKLQFTVVPSHLIISLVKQDLVTHYAPEISH